MNNIILNVNTLLELLYWRIRSEKVKVYEVNAIITLVPIVEKRECTNRLFDMFSDRKLSAEKYIIQKQLNKELKI